MGYVRNKTFVHIGIILVYCIVSFSIFSSVLLNFSQSYLGGGADPLLFMWFMRWIPFAIDRGLNPFWTNYILFPSGVNLMWNTSVPLASIVLWPITHFLGILASYNTLVIISLPLSAISMYFVLRMFSFGIVASFAGGLLFGFNPYMIAQSLGHTQLTSPAFLIPNLFWILWDLFGGQRRSSKFNGLLLGAVVVMMLLLGEEVMTTAALISMFGIIITFIMNKGIHAVKVGYIVRSLLYSFGMIVIFSGVPLFTQFFGPSIPHGQLQPPNVYVTDLYNFITPGPLQQLSNSGTNAISNRFTGNESEWNSYVSLPLILIFLSSIFCLKKSILLKFSFWMTFIVAVLSMGPFLHIDGTITNIPLPWILFGALPLLNDILPDRLSIYMFFFIAIIFAGFIKQIGNFTKVSQVLSITSILSTFIFLMPLINFPVTTVLLPPFFTNEIKRIIPHNSTVMVLPFSTGAHASAMYWQQASGFWFKMPEGYAISPNGFGPSDNALLDVLNSNSNSNTALKITPNIREESLGYLDRFGIKYIVLARHLSNSQYQEKVISSILNANPIQTSGVDLWIISAKKNIGYYIGGQYWASESEYNWMGKNATIQAFGKAVTVRIAGFWRPLNIPVKVVIKEDNNIMRVFQISTSTNVSFTVASGKIVTISADSTFIPNNYIHNGDDRKLSVLLSVSH
ncbi:hypothetical protein [Ferroacidibacillus organovorans]|nr:hypothetical protein [Ferroacidibacillus organovorans]